MYREGLVRFASEKYSNDSLDEADSKFSHLTNYSINKNNHKYVPNDDAVQEDSGFKWSISAFCQHMEKEGVDLRLMWAKIYDLIIKSVLAIDE